MQSHNTTKIVLDFFQSILPIRFGLLILQLITNDVTNNYLLYIKVLRSFFQFEYQYMITNPFLV